MTESPYITTQELATLIRVKPNTIERWRTNRECPIQHTRIKGKVLYLMADVNKYLESQRRDRTGNK